MSQRTYGQWAGNPNGKRENTACCIASVWPSYTGAFPIPSQCSRKRGHGPNGEYCTQHGKKEDERLERTESNGKD